MANFSAHSSESLIRACVGHDNEAAWAEFVRRFQPLIAKVAGRTARRNWSQVPPHVVDDLVQETYLRLCADRCRLLRQFQSRHQNSIYGFLKVVAASVVLDYFKGELALKRDAGQTDSLSERGSPARPLTSNCSRLSTEDGIALRQIDGILRKLYTDEILIRNRAIFWLHYRDGMTAQAIASTPWISLKTKGVETALRRMTQLIQGHIGNIH